MKVSDGKDDNSQIPLL